MAFDARAPLTGSPAELPVFPQARAAAAWAMGDPLSARAQVEDAFLVNVWAPEGASGLPVVVFLHGGAWATGGAIEWYDGARLASQGVVVVVPSFRIGALAHLAPESPGALPPPLPELLTALSWVREHAAAFGGDGQNVTLSGQSSGAWYAWLLAGMPESAGLIRRLALFSMATRAPWTGERLSAMRDRVRRLLGGEPLELVPAARLVDAGRQALAEDSLGSGHAATVYLPALDAERAAAFTRPRDSAARAAANGVTSALFRVLPHETALFLAVDPGIDAEGYEELVAESTRVRYREPIAAIAAASADAGFVVRKSVFEEPSPAFGPGDGMTGHCLDLPYQFGNPQDWARASMLDGAIPERFEAESARLIAELAGFASDCPHPRR